MSFSAYPIYKDSEVIWLGEVPASWEVKSFKWVLSRNDGGVWGDDPTGVDDTLVLRSTDQTVDGKWKITEPAIRSLSINEKIMARLVTGDLLVTKSSGSALHIGKTTLVNNEIAIKFCCYSNFMQRLRVNSNYIPKLAWYIMNNEIARQQLDLYSNSTTGLANLNATLIGEIKLPVPSIFEQNQIAKFLDHETAHIDALIEEQHRLIELLKEKRQAVISLAVTKGLDPTVPMKNSGVEWLGEVPAHWEVVNLKRVVVFQRGHDLPSDAREVGEVPIISSGGYSGTHSIACAKAPGIVTGRYGSIGQFILAEEDYWPLNTALYSIELYANMPRYVWWLLQAYAEHFLLNSLKSAVPGVDRNDIHDVKVVVAPKEEQVLIVAYIDRLCSQFDQLVCVAEKNRSLLQERRSALISAAVTGKIDVRGWKPPASAKVHELEEETM